MYPICIKRVLYSESEYKLVQDIIYENDPDSQS